MKAHYKTKNGRIVFEIQAETPKAIFKHLAQLQEVFEAAEKCGACGSEAIRYRVREPVQTEFYYELHCEKCHAALAFGQLRDGAGLFVKRKDERGTLLPYGGWVKYVKPAPQPAAKNSGGAA